MVGLLDGVKEDLLKRMGRWAHSHNRHATRTGSSPISEQSAWKSPIAPNRALFTDRSVATSQNELSNQFVRSLCNLDLDSWFCWLTQVLEPIHYTNLAFGEDNDLIAHFFDVMQYVGT